MGTEYGIGTFQATFNGVINGIKYANNPTERYIQAGETVESPPFDQPIGSNSEVHQGDMRELSGKEVYDAVITDPPYYDNVIYSELSDYYYVWQRILLKDEYDAFEPEKTPRTESIVANPAVEKGQRNSKTSYGSPSTRFQSLLNRMAHWFSLTTTVTSNPGASYWVLCVT